MPASKKLLFKQEMLIKAWKSIENYKDHLRNINYKYQWLDFWSYERFVGTPNNLAQLRLRNIRQVHTDHCVRS